MLDRILMFMQKKMNKSRNRKVGQKTKLITTGKLINKKARQINRSSIATKTSV